MAVLLIGSTGSGKSTLGNFLLDPDDIDLDGKHFEIATDNLPKTSRTQLKTLKVTFPHLTQEDDGESPDIGVVPKTQQTEAKEVGVTSHQEDDDSTGTSVSGDDQSTEGAPSTKNFFVKMKDTGARFLGLKNTMTKDLTVIDTPGLNESPEKDLEHMINLVTKLQKVGTIQACIFVTKFQSKIDQQYADTIKYYSRLRPSLFSHNSIIVMTDYPTDKRRRRNIEIDKIMRNVGEKIKEFSGICYEPIIFALDCLPYEEDRDEVSKAKDIRNAILSCIFSQRPVNMKGLQVAKTKSLLDGDEKYIKCYEGEIQGYNTRLKQVHQDAKAILTVVQQKQHEISMTNKELTKLREYLKLKNTDEVVTAAVWKVDETWKFFETQCEVFDITSKWEITSVSKWTNGRCKWQDIVQVGKRVHGTVQGKFMRGLYARVTLETTKNIKFATEIKEVNRSITKEDAARVKATQELDSSIKDQSSKQIAIQLLLDFIKEKNELISERTGNLMTLEEAQSRLDEYYITGIKDLKTSDD